MRLSKIDMLARSFSYLPKWNLQTEVLDILQVVTDFFDELKSRSQGYASMEYHITGYRKNDLVRLDIKINGELAEPLANIVHRSNAYHVGRALTKRLKELIPRQQFKVPIQAAIGAKVVASESIAGLAPCSAKLQSHERDTGILTPQAGQWPHLAERWRQICTMI